MGSQLCGAGSRLQDHIALLSVEYNGDVSYRSNVTSCNKDIITNLSSYFRVSQRFVTQDFDLL